MTSLKVLLVLSLICSSEITLYPVQVHALCGVYDGYCACEDDCADYQPTIFHSKAFLLSLSQSGSAIFSLQ